MPLAWGVVRRPAGSRVRGVPRVVVPRARPDPAALASFQTEKTLEFLLESWRTQRHLVRDVFPPTGEDAARMALVWVFFVRAQQEEDAYARDDEDGGENDDEDDEAGG